MASPRLLHALAIAFPLTWAGCGASRVPTYPVSGSVHFEDGQPVPYAVIEFREEGSRLSARAKLDKDGTFVLGTFKADDGAPAGDYRVIVVQHFDIPLRANDPRRHGERFEHAHESGDSIQVATEFADFSTSGLRATVGPDSDNEFEFVVRRESPRRRS